MFTLVLEKAEEPEIKLPIFTGSSKKQKSSRKSSISALLTMPKPLTVWITINCGKFCRRWEYQSEKVGLKLNIQKTKIMASGHIISREIDGETVETVSDFIFLGSKITADGDCSHEIKRHLIKRRFPVIW